MSFTSNLAYRSLAALAFACTALCAEGCQSVMLSDDRIASSTAGLLGVAPSDLTISDRRDDGMTNTYYTATTKNEKAYACTINGGGLLAAGMVNPPSCSPKP